MTESQKEAAKHKTARISLSDAMGVAPVKSENAPIKTIRIKRPVGIGGASRPTTSIAPPVAAPEPAPKSDAAETADAAATESAEAKPTAAPAPAAVPRKTLKISRPGGSVRPTKFGLKRPSPASAASAKPASDATGENANAPEGGEGAVADIPEIAEIPDVASGALAPAAKAASADSDGPAWLWTLSSLVQTAACVAIGALAWMLYQNTQTLYF